MGLKLKQITARNGKQIAAHCARKREGEIEKVRAMEEGRGD